VVSVLVTFSATCKSARLARVLNRTHAQFARRACMCGISFTPPVLAYLHLLLFVLATEIGHVPPPPAYVSLSARPKIARLAKRAPSRMQNACAIFSLQFHHHRHHGKHNCCYLWQIAIVNRRAMSKPAQTVF